MLDFESQPPLSSSSRRVQSWLDSLYHHNSSQSDEDKKIYEKSSLASNQSTKSSTKNSTKNSKKSLSSASSSALGNQRVRRLQARRPRYLVRKSSRKSNRKATSDMDQSSSYLSNSSADESNLFSNMSTLNFLNEDSAMPEIRADDLDFDSRNSLTSIGSNCTSNNYSSHNHSFGVLDFERWKTGLQLGDELTLKVKTYAFAEKDIKIRLKGNTLVVRGCQTTEEENGYFKREFKKKFDLPYNTDKKNIKYDFDMNDHLIITIPRTIHSVH